MIVALASRVKSAITALSSTERIRILLYIVIALHVAKVGRLLPIENLLDGSPLIEYNHSKMYADVMNDRSFRAVSGRSWGYNPFIGAGGPAGSAVVPESHAAILFDRLLRRWLDPALTIKLFVWLCLVTGPLLIFLASRFLGFSEAASLIAVCLATAGALGHEQLSRILVYRGGTAFWLGAHVAILNGAALHAGVLTGSRTAALTYVATIPVMMLLDPALAFVQAIPLAAIIVGAPARQRLSAVGWTVIGVAAGLVLNSFWIRPFFIFHKFVITFIEWPTTGFRGIFQMLMPFGNGLLPGIYAAVRAGIIGFGVAELMFRSSEFPRTSRSLLFWAAGLLLVGYFGGYLAWCAQFDPGRFPFLLILLLTMPASQFLSAVFLRPGSFRILFFVWAMWMGVSWQTVHRLDPQPIRQEFVTLERELAPIFWHLPRERRVMVEYHPVVNDLLRVVASWTGHSYLGFPSTWRTTVFSRSAGFEALNGVLYIFGRQASSYDAQTFRKSMDMYNVGTIVTVTEKAKTFIELFPDLLEEQPESRGRQYGIFVRRGDAGSGYFIEGKGRVKLQRDLIRVYPAAPGPATISLHYIEGLKVSPPAEIHGRYVEGDEVPFISVNYPAGMKEIEIRYEPR